MIDLIHAFFFIFVGFLLGLCLSQYINYKLKKISIFSPTKGGGLDTFLPNLLKSLKIPPLDSSFDSGSGSGIVPNPTPGKKKRRTRSLQEE